MGICSLRPINTVTDDVDIDPNEGGVEGNTEENEGDVQVNSEENKNTDDVDTGSNEGNGEGNTEENKDTDDEGDVEGNTEENNIRGSVQDFASSSQSFSTPVMITKFHFEGMVRDTSCYWVYARFSDLCNFVGQSLYAFDIKDNKYVRLPKPNHPMHLLMENTSSVLDYNLYVIGGRKGMDTSNSVHLFDPLLNNWSATTSTTVARREALAVSVEGRIYVFGGCSIQIPEWAEVYEPSTKTWRPIPHSETLARALERFLSPQQAFAVLGNRIILRGYGTGIAFDVNSNSWIPVSNNLIENWWEGTRAAVVQNMLITCYGHNSHPEKFQPSIRAYDPDDDVWLMLEGIDSSFHENANRSEFMSVNGKLVIYHMWEQDHLTFSVVEINEKVGTSVRASLLWQSLFPIATIINEGMDIHPERLRKCLYEQSLVEAFKADV